MIQSLLAHDEFEDTETDISIEHTLCQAPLVPEVKTVRLYFHFLTYSCSTPPQQSGFCHGRTIVLIV